MAANQRLNIFTGAMRSEFINAYEETAVPAPYLNYTQVIPSNARTEHYPWLSPTAGIDEYKGHRRVAKLSEILYSVDNKEYDSSFEVLLRDLQDDQTGGYALKSRELGEKAKKFPGREVLRHLSYGKTRLCFDGSAFFADSHTIGTGDNLMSKNCASNDGLTHNIVVLIHTSPVKPLIWQQRKDPDLQDDMDSDQAKFSKVGRFWVDMEGAAAYGRWHDAILYEITDTPSITEMQTILGEIEDRFRTFRLPTALASDTNEYVHEQIEFSPQNVTMIVSSGLGNLARQVLKQTEIVNSGAAVTNIFHNWSDLVISGIINTVS